MSWGDPFESFYKDDAAERMEVLSDLGLTPGTLVVYGQDNMLTMWRGPEFTSECFDIKPGMGTIVSVDCENDPVNNWLYIFINSKSNTQSFGWLPSGTVRKV